jgi:hypothetical protein
MSCLTESGPRLSVPGGGGLGSRDIISALLRDANSSGGVREEVPPVQQFYEVSDSLHVGYVLCSDDNNLEASR